MRLFLPALLLIGCNPPHEVLARCADAPGVICPWAGTGANGFNGDGLDRHRTSFSFPVSATVSDLGPTIVADWNNHKLRRLEADDTFTTVMGTDLLGDGDALGLELTAEGAPGTTVALNHPTQQQYLADGTLLSASWHTHKLRTWDPDTGRTHIFLGDTPGFNPAPGDDPEAFTDADDCLLNQPSAVEIRPDGDIYIVDMRNERIRLLRTDDWLVGTVAGNGEQDYCGEGDALETCFAFPKSANPEPGGSIAYDAARDLLYIADTENHVIRVLDVEAGVTRLLAGSPQEPGDVDGTGTIARFDLPTRVAFDAATDTLFVADPNNHKVRAVDVTTGAVRTFAGTGEPTCPIPSSPTAPQICEEQPRSGDGGPATEARLYRPFGVDLDPQGNVIIADTYNNRFRIVYR